MSQSKLEMAAPEPSHSASCESLWLGESVPSFRDDGANVQGAKQGRTAQFTVLWSFADKRYVQLLEKKSDVLCKEW